MTASPSRLAYADCQEVFDTALDDPLGIRIPFDSVGAAQNFRMRLHKFRMIDREDNARTYDRHHAMYGRSTYDVIRATIMDENGLWYLYLEPVVDASRLVIERLSEIGPRTVELRELPHQKESVYEGAPAPPPVQRMRRF